MGPWGSQDLPKAMGDRWASQGSHMGHRICLGLQEPHRGDGGLPEAVGVLWGLRGSRWGALQCSLCQPQLFLWQKFSLPGAIPIPVPVPVPIPAPRGGQWLGDPSTLCSPGPGWVPPSPAPRHCGAAWDPDPGGETPGAWDEGCADQAGLQGPLLWLVAGLRRGRQGRWAGAAGKGGNQEEQRGRCWGAARSSRRWTCR